MRQIAPDAQLRIRRVLHIDAPVAIGVELSQHTQSTRRVVHPTFSEQIGRTVDRTRAVAVDDEDALARAEPIRFLRKTIGIDVEQHPLARGAISNDDAPTIQVQHDGLEVCGGRLGLRLGVDLARQYRALFRR